MNDNNLHCIESLINDIYLVLDDISTQKSLKGPNNTSTRKQKSRIKEVSEETNITLKKSVFY
jgi:hypothetical protein